jgi:hypothetical protein
LLLKLECGLSPLLLAAYFDALSSSAGFASSVVEASDNGLVCEAWQPQRSLSLRTSCINGLQRGSLTLSRERNLVLSAKREYRYEYGKLVSGAYPPGFPSLVLSPLPGAVLVFAAQHGPGRASLGQNTRLASITVETFYHQHFSECGFRAEASYPEPAIHGHCSVYKRENGVAKVLSYPLHDVLRVEVSYDAGRHV